MSTNVSPNASFVAEGRFHNSKTGIAAATTRSTLRRAYLVFALDETPLDGVALEPQDIGLERSPTFHEHRDPQHHEDHTAAAQEFGPPLPTGTRDEQQQKRQRDDRDDFDAHRERIRETGERR